MARKVKAPIKSKSKGTVKNSAKRRTPGRKIKKRQPKKKSKGRGITKTKRTTKKNKRSVKPRQGKNKRKSPIRKRPTGKTKKAGKGSKHSSKSKPLKYHKNHKTLAYIKDVIRKYYPGKAKDKKELNETAREVRAYLIQGGLEFNIKNIKLALSAIKKRKEEAGKGMPPKPFIDPAAFLNEHYFNIEQLLSLAVLFPKEVSIRGKMVFDHKDRRYKGGDLIPYSEVSDFVQFCDELRAKHRDEIGIDDYDNQWFVRFTELCDDKKSKQWFTQLISCDVDGVKVNYGFRGRTNKEIEDECEEPTSAPPGGPVPPPPVPPTPPTTPTGGVEEEAKVAIAKIDILTKQKESLMADIKFFKEIGLPFEKELNELRKIQEQIAGVSLSGNSVQAIATPVVAVTPETKPAKNIWTQLNLFPE